MAPRIQAPNGEIYDMPDATVSGLLGGSPANGWKAVETPPNGVDDGTARAKAAGGLVPGGKPVSKPRKPAKTASLEKWTEYAEAIGAPIPVNADVDAIRAAVDRHGKAPKADADTGKTSDSTGGDTPPADGAGNDEDGAGDGTGDDQPDDESGE